jgi:hypothetical protein
VFLSKVTGKKEWIVAFTDYNIGLLSISIAYIHSYGKDFSSMVTAICIIKTMLMLAAGIIVALRVSQGFQGCVWMVLLSVRLN